MFFFKVLESANMLVDAEPGIQVYRDIGRGPGRHLLGGQLHWQPTPANGEAQAYQPPDPVQGNSNHTRPLLAIIRLIGKIFSSAHNRAGAA